MKTTSEKSFNAANAEAKNEILNGKTGECICGSSCTSGNCECGCK